MLIAGKERQFLSRFHNAKAVNARAFTNETEDIYARAYSTQERCGQGSRTIEHPPRTWKQTQKSKRERLSRRSWLGTVFRLLMMKIMEGTDLFGLLHDGRDDTNAFGIGTQADA
jgi:hypothetical protein